MANRRQFLQGAAAVSAAPLASRTFSKGRESAALDAVVYDRRHQQARDFGACAASLGARAHPIEGDITDLWTRELLRRWTAAPGAVAGLTERPALFLLERLGWEHGLRVVFEAEHEPGANNQVRHRLVRSADAELANELQAAGAGWPGLLADTLVMPHHAMTRDFHPSDAAMAAHLAEKPKLYSWVLAPRGAVVG